MEELRQVSPPQPLEPILPVQTDLIPVQPASPNPTFFQKMTKWSVFFSGLFVFIGVGLFIIVLNTAEAPQPLRDNDQNEVVRSNSPKVLGMYGGALALWDTEKAQHSLFPNFPVADAMSSPLLSPDRRKLAVFVETSKEVGAQKPTLIIYDLTTSTVLYRGALQLSSLRFTTMAWDNESRGVIYDARSITWADGPASSMIERYRYVSLAENSDTVLYEAEKAMSSSEVSMELLGYDLKNRQLLGFLNGRDGGFAILYPHILDIPQKKHLVLSPPLFANSPKGSAHVSPDKKKIVGSVYPLTPEQARETRDLGSVVVKVYATNMQIEPVVLSKLISVRERSEGDGRTGIFFANERLYFIDDDTVAYIESSEGSGDLIVFYSISKNDVVSTWQLPIFDPIKTVKYANDSLIEVQPNAVVTTSRFMTPSLNQYFPEGFTPIGLLAPESISW